jgi:hypothetical protein
MDRFNALSRGMQVMLVAGVLLFVDMFLNWQDYDVGDIGTFNGWHGFGGVLLGLLTILLLAWLGARMAGIDIPLPVSASLLAAAFGAAIFIDALLKNLVDDESTFWSYIGLILAVLMAVGAWLQVQATGGMDALKTELPSMQTPGTATTTAPPPPTETAPPPPTETAPPPTSAPPDTAQPAPPPPPAATPPMGEPAAPVEEPPAEEEPATSSGLEPSTEPPEEQR